MRKLARCQLVPRYGPKIRTAPPGYNWYQHVSYGFHDGKEFVTLHGRMQLRYRGKGAIQVSTVVDFKGSVRGTDLGWLIQQCGYELITDDEYWFNVRQAEADKHNPDAALLRHSGEED